MNKIMLDLETMGNSANSAIIAIGAVRFDNDKLLDEFYTVVDLQSCLDNGLEMNADTVLWWMQQSEQARNQFKRKGEQVDVVLDDFSKWMRSRAEVWGNGAAFDNAILANAYKKLGKEQPWAFWNDRCYRTMKSLYPEVKIQRQGTYHNALDDAKSQAEHLIRILKQKDKKLPLFGGNL